LSIALTAALGSSKRSTLKEAYEALDQTLEADAQFVAFLGGRAEKARLAAEAEKADRKATLALARDFATQYASRNITAAATAELLPFIDKTSDILSAGKDDEIESALTDAQAIIARNDLKSEFERHVTLACGTDSAGKCREANAMIASLSKDGGGKAGSGGGEAVTDQKTVTVDSAPPEPAQALGKRVALVIGNSDYRNAVTLPNPRNDARAMAAALKTVGFDVIEGEDLAKVELEDAVRRFAQRVSDADVALFFYAGHGMQVNGHNYLIPVDAELQDQTAIDFETVSLDKVTGYMQSEKRISIALLDACRDNPLARRFARSLGASRSAAVSQGLALPNADGGGMLIGFATSPDKTAADGDGANSPFTTALIKHITSKGVEIEQMFKRVKRDVSAETKGEQIPWTNAALLTDFYFNP
jgi:hypothetical protein